MPWGYAAAAAGTYLASKNQKDAADEAAGATTQASQAGIDEQRREFDQVQQLLSPYVTAGNGAVTAQQNLLGLNGNGAQQTAIDGIQNSAQFQALTHQGEEAILANASATGGLRGGNTQGALAQFRPQLLAQLIDQQYQRLGGLTNVGQASAAGVGSAAQQTGNAVTTLLGQQGSAQAGAALANGKANSQLINGLANTFGSYFGGKF
jgi:hypothetical protein